MNFFYPSSPSSTATNNRLNKQKKLGISYATVKLETQCNIKHTILLRSVLMGT